MESEERKTNITYKIKLSQLEGLAISSRNAFFSSEASDVHLRLLSLPETTLLKSWELASHAGPILMAIFCHTGDK